MTHPEATALPFVDYERPALPWGGLIILGEAPGRQEVELGHPFAGRSGALLGRALQAAGIERRACLVANVFRYRPPDNDPRAFFISEREAVQTGEEPAREYGRHTLGFCRVRYAEEIRHLAATIATARAVIALGAIPLWATTGRQGVKANAGSVRPGRLAPVPVVATYHPAFILRGNWQYDSAWHWHLEFAQRLCR